MIIIDSIYVTFLNGFDKLDWKLRNISNDALKVRFDIEDSAIGFLSIILTLIISIPLILKFGNSVYLAAVALFFVIAYLVNKNYLHQKGQLKEKVNSSIFKSRPLRISTAILFMLLPIIEVLVMREFVSA